MKKWLVVISLGVPFRCFGQIPVQLFVGENSVEYSFFWYKDLDSKGKVNLFNFTFFDLNYEHKSENSYEIYQIATCRISDAWGVIGGGRFNAGQLLPLIGISYELQRENLYLNVLPSLQWSFVSEMMGCNMFTILIYEPKINERWDFFSQCAFEPLFDKEGHSFSYQQIRMGLGYEQKFQFGVGLNLNHTGRSFSTDRNIGLFIRKEL